MRVHIDKATGGIIQIESAKNSSGANVVKRRDTVTVVVRFDAGDGTGLSLLASNYALAACVRPAGTYSGDPLAYEATWTESTTAKTYTAELDLNTTQMATAFAALASDADDELSAALEFSWSEDSGATWQSTPRIALTIENDVVTGSESPPQTATAPWEDPANGTVGQVLTADGAGNATWEDPSSGGASSEGGNGSADAGKLAKFDADGWLTAAGFQSKDPVYTTKTFVQPTGFEYTDVAGKGFLIAAATIGYADNRTVRVPDASGTIALVPDAHGAIKTSDIADASDGGNSDSDGGKAMKFTSVGFARAMELLAVNGPDPLAVGYKETAIAPDGVEITGTGGSITGKLALTARTDGVPDAIIPANQSTTRTQLGAGTVGDALFTAATVQDAKTAIGTVTKTKESDQSSTSSTYADSTGLAGFALAANTNYMIRWCIHIVIATSAGLKCQFVISGGAANAFGDMEGVGIQNRRGNLQSITFASSGTVAALGSTTTGTGCQFSGFLTLRTGASGGSLALQQAQNTTDAGNPSTLKAGSWVSVETL